MIIECPWDLNLAVFPIDIRPFKPQKLALPFTPIIIINWLEYFVDIGQDDQIDKIREFIELKLASSGLFAILNVGETTDKV